MSKIQCNTVYKLFTTLEKLKKAGLPTDFNFAATLTKKQKENLKVSAFTCPECTAVSDILLWLNVPLLICCMPYTVVLSK